MSNWRQLQESIHADVSLKMDAAGLFFFMKTKVDQGPTSSGDGSDSDSDRDAGNDNNE
jgi:hypothetical protein